VSSAPLLAADLNLGRAARSPEEGEVAVRGAPRVPGTDSSLTHRWRGMDSNVQFRAIGPVSKLCRLSADLSCGEDALSR
jgi:hypothetical protein